MDPGSKHTVSTSSNSNDEFRPGELLMYQFNNGSAIAVVIVPHTLKSGVGLRLASGRLHERISALSSVYVGPWRRVSP